MSSPSEPGQPWMCARHHRAGLSSELACCKGAVRVADRDRLRWYEKRIAGKSPRVRADIILARGNPHGAMQTIATHNHAAGKQWIWLVLASRPT